jgi:hypothetical protein
VFILAHLLPAFLDFFGLLLIHAGEFVARLAHYMQHLVELGMNCLRVAVLRALKTLAAYREGLQLGGNAGILASHSISDIRRRTNSIWFNDAQFNWEHNFHRSNFAREPFFLHVE